MEGSEKTETTQTGSENGDEGKAGSEESKTRQRAAEEGKREEERSQTEGREEEAGKKDESFPWDELNRLKREASERDKKERDRERKRQEDEGKFKEMAASEKERADEEEGKRKKLERDIRLEKVAKEAGLRHPEDASRYLTDDQMSDDRSARAALDDLKEDREELFEEQRRSGGEVQPGAQPAGEGEGDGEAFGFDRLRGVKRKN